MMAPAPKFVLVCLAISTSCWALRRSTSKGRASSQTQRGDDMQIQAQGSGLAEARSTVNGCVCKNDCKLKYPLNCNAAQFCNVGEECSGSKRSLLYGRYDYCVFKDAATKEKSAAQRFASLVAKLREDATPQAYFGGVEIAVGVRGESMVDTMDMEYDEFPYPRKKFVRPVGVVAPIRFESTRNHPYTGVFKGSDLGIIRLSLSLEPTEKKGFVPGVAVKFFREGRPSANFLGFTSFIGQNCSEKNFFKYDMYTNVPPASGLSKLVPLKFKQASWCTQMVGLSDAADDFDGWTPVFPFDIIFEGLQSADFSCGDGGAAGWANLGKFTKGTRLFRLKAKAGPKEEAVTIGDIVLDGSLATSKFGDERLFFQHQRMEEDFALNPEWLNGIDKLEECGTSKASTVPPKPDEGCTA